MQIKQYPNYRVIIEAVIVNAKENKVLLTKRASNCLAAPNRWCVPAGKAKYEEIPTAACLREAKEETQLDMIILKEIGVRAFKGSDSKGNVNYRLVFTYLTKIIGKRKKPIINEEHSEFCWATKKQLDESKFNTMDKELKKFIKTNLN